MALMILPLLGIGQTIDWERNFGGTLTDRGFSVRKDNSGGYIVGGRSNSSNIDVPNNYGGWDFWLLKLNDNGSIEWDRNYGGSADDVFSDISPSLDGGFVACGSSESTDMDVSNNNGGRDIWVLKVDSNGNIKWEQNFGGSSNEWANTISSIDGGGYYIGGRSQSSDGDVSGNNGNTDLWVLKLDKGGNLLWETNLGGSDKDVTFGGTSTSDGGFIVTGRSWSSDGDVGNNNGDADAWVAKLDSNGNLEWSSNYGGSGEDGFWTAHETANGDFLFAGGSFSSDGDLTGNQGGEDMWVVRTDDSGTIKWQKNYGGSQDERAVSIDEGPLGDYLISGISQSSDGDVSANKGNFDHWSIKMDGNGKTLWEKNFGGSDWDRLFSSDRDGKGYIQVGGSRSSDGDVSNNNGDKDIWIVRIEDTVRTDLPVFSQKENPALKIHPNPFDEELRIQHDGTEELRWAELLDMQGRSVLQRNLGNREPILRPDIEKGVYILRVHTEDEVYQKKLIKR